MFFLNIDVPQNGPVSESSTHIRAYRLVKSTARAYKRVGLWRGWQHIGGQYNDE